MSQEPPITIYPSVWKLLLILIGATPILLLFLALVAFAVYSAGSGELRGFTVVGGVTVVVGVLFIVFGVLLFGYIVVYAAYRLLVRRPVLVVDADGIMVHWAPMPVGLIRWTDIESVGAYTQDGRYALGLVLRDREAFMRRQPRLRRSLLALLALVSRDVPPVNIGQAILPTDVHTLAAQIKTAYGAKFGGPAPRPVPTISPGTAITIYPNKRTLLLALGVFTLSIASGVFLAVADLGSGLGAVIITLAGYAFAVSFGAVAIYAAHRLLAREPTLVIDADGILDRSSPLAVGLIRWTEIDSVVPYGHGDDRALRVMLRDPEAFMRRQPRLRRWMSALDRRFGLPSVSFAQINLSMDVETLAELLNRNYSVKLVRGPQELVPFESCRIEYGLTRRQRLMAHLGVWALWLPPLVIVAGGISALIIAISVAVSPWFLPFLVVPLWLARRFTSGLLNVLFVRLQHVDVVIEEDGLRFDTEGGFWTYGVAGDFTGIAQLRKYSRDTWTILSGNGFVVSIPVAAIEQQYIDHIRAKADLP